MYRCVENIGLYTDENKVIHQNKKSLARMDLTSKFRLISKTELFTKGNLE